MCDDGCTDHGRTIYVPPGHAVYVYPATDTQATAAIQGLTNQGPSENAD